MRARFWSACACVALTMVPCPPTQERQRFQRPSFSIELPVSWRQVTPSELPELRAILPPDIHVTRPNSFYTVGPIDRWLAGDYDGVQLVVHEQGNELSMDQAGVDRILGHWKEASGTEGLRHEVVSSTITHVGPDNHPAIVCQRLIVPEGPGTPIQSLDAYIPTGGRQILFSFRSRQEDFSEHLAEFRNMLASATFARRARGSQTLGNRLILPAAVGAFVGLMLLVLRRRRVA